MVYPELVVDFVELAGIHAKGYNQVLTHAEGLCGDAEEDAAGGVAAPVWGRKEYDTSSYGVEDGGLFIESSHVESLRVHSSSAFPRP